MQNKNEVAEKVRVIWRSSGDYGSYGGISNSDCNSFGIVPGEQLDLTLSRDRIGSGLYCFSANFPCPIDFLTIFYYIHRFLQWKKWKSFRCPRDCYQIVSWENLVRGCVLIFFLHAFRICQTKFTFYNSWLQGVPRSV